MLKGDHMTTRFLGAIAVASITATFGFPAVTAAKAGDRTFQQTYPVASKLCTNLAAGGGPKRLRPYATQVGADCTTLKSGFEAAQNAVLVAQTAFANALAADRAAIAAVCTPPVGNRPLCRRTRRSERLVIGALRGEHRAAVVLYYRTIEVNRRTFWAAVKALPGGANLPKDAPIPQQSG
jgi:hypothetical protein